MLITSFYFYCRSLLLETFQLEVATSNIASQGIISVAFSKVSQAMNMGCFPKVKFVQTSITLKLLQKIIANTNVGSNSHQNKCLSIKGIYSEKKKKQ